MAQVAATVVLGSCLSLLAGGCSSASGVSSPELTSAAYLTAYREAEASAQATRRGAYPEALSLFGEQDRHGKEISL